MALLLITVDTLFCICEGELPSIDVNPDKKAVAEQSPVLQSESFVAVAVVGEVPVLLSEERDVDSFRDGATSAFLCVDDAGTVRLLLSY